MHGDAVKEIAERSAKPFEIGDAIVSPAGWVITHKENVRVKAQPAAPTFSVATLGALRDYLKENRDQLDLAKVIVHVETPYRVTVGSVLRDGSRDRELFITAEVKDLLLADNFLGTFKAQEDMVVGLQTRFLDADQRADVLRVVGTIREDAVQTLNDDGMTQQVTASAGTVMVQSTNLPNPVKLTGYRTFRDIRQPSVQYVLRAKGGSSNGHKPTVALFEADGGAWQLGTIADIHNWLKTNLPDGVAVLA